MNRKSFIAFGQQHLKSWGISLLISFCLLFVFLIGIAPQETPHMKKARSLSIPNAFKQILDPFTPVLNLIVPEQLGITQWQIGEYAQYQYHRYQSQLPLFPLSAADADKIVEFHIIGELEANGSHYHWMKTTGTLFFRQIPGDIYQLVRLADMRMTSENRRYRFVQNYIPSKERFYEQNSLPIVKLVKLGPAEIETRAGHFKCMHYRVELGPDFPTHEIWANAKVGPLGIVRMQSQNEILELISFGQKTDITVPKLFQPVIQGTSKLDHGCTSCHGSDNCHESIFPPK